jgi:hypothetical protein
VCSNYDNKSTRAMLLRLDQPSYEKYFCGENTEPVYAELGTNMLFSFNEFYTEFLVAVRQLPYDWEDKARETLLRRNSAAPDSDFVDLRSMERWPDVHAFPLLDDFKGIHEGKRLTREWSLLGGAATPYGPVRACKSPPSRLNASNEMLQHVGSLSGHHHLDSTQERKEWYKDQKMKHNLNSVFAAKVGAFDPYIRTKQDWSQSKTVEYYSKGVSGFSGEFVLKDMPVMSNFRIKPYEEVGWVSLDPSSTPNLVGADGSPIADACAFLSTSMCLSLLL